MVKDIRSFFQSLWICRIGVFVFGIIGSFFVFSDTVLARKLFDVFPDNRIGTETGLGETTPNKAALKVISAALQILALLFIVLLLYGGFRWMLSRGNEEEVTKAKDILKAAVIGLVIVLAALGIAQYAFGIIESVTL